MCYTLISKAPHLPSGETFNYIYPPQKHINVYLLQVISLEGGLREDSDVWYVALLLAVRMCVLVLNLGSLVSRGGGEEESVWRDMTGQNSSLMGLDVLQLLSTFYVPHLDSAIKGPGQQSCVVGWAGEQREASDLFLMTLKYFALPWLPPPHLQWNRKTKKSKKSFSYF